MYVCGDANFFRISLNLFSSEFHVVREEKDKPFKVLVYCITVVQGLHHLFKISIVPHLLVVNVERRVDFKSTMFKK